MNRFRITVTRLLLIGWALWPHLQASAGDTSITVTANGPGTIWPNYNGKHLPVGILITVSAKPAPGYIFAGWKGAESPFANTFVVRPGLVLEALFLPDPFRTAAGRYSGLVYEPNSAPPASAGRFNLNLDPAGRIQGTLFFHDHADNFWGMANDSLNRPLLDGGSLRGWIYSLMIMRGDLWDGTLELVMTSELQIDFLNGQITGTLTNDRYWRGVHHAGTWIAPMEGYRNGVKDYYTLALVGTEEDGSVPAGAGFATINIDMLGKIKVSGFLPDGTAIFQRVTDPGDGTCSISNVLYRGRGFLEGTLQVASLQPGGGENGLLWSKPPTGTGKRFQPGFTEKLRVFGARYTRPMPGQPAYTRGIAVFSSGGLAAPFTNSFTAGPKNTFVNTSANRMTLTVIPETGSFSGTVKPPDSSAMLRFKGALLQPDNTGYGFFLGAKKQSGRVVLLPLAGETANSSPVDR